MCSDSDIVLPLLTPPGAFKNSRHNPVTTPHHFKMTPNPCLVGFRCTLCQREYELNAVTYTCPVCGEAGTLDMVYDTARLRPHLADWKNGIAGPFDMWRYAELLPIDTDTQVPPLAVGGTPLIRAGRLAAQHGLRELWLKDDGRNPTGSLKDRASAMVVAHATEIGASVVTTASTGNAAAALAGICASMGMKSVIFVPSNAPSAKIAQLLVYGATVLLVQGTYDQAFDLCMQAALDYGWYCRNTGINPYTTEGKKTAALEMAEQLGWQVPDALIVSVGDGSIIGGQYKGFRDLYECGLIDRMPRLIGVQAEGSRAVEKAWREHLDIASLPPQPADTLADSISAALPRDRVKALRAVTVTNGAYITVSDQQILDAIPALARGSGVFVEPACAATYAGLLVALERGVVQPGESVGLLLTGNGLKDVRSAMRSVGVGAAPDGNHHGSIPDSMPGYIAGYPVAANIGDVRQLIDSLHLT